MIEEVYSLVQRQTSQASALHTVAEQAVYLCAACGAWKMISSVKILQCSPLLMGILGSVLEGLLRHIWHPLNFTPRHLSSITCLDNSSSTAPARTSFNSHGSHKACNILIRTLESAQIGLQSCDLKSSEADAYWQELQHLAISKMTCSVGGETCWHYEIAHRNNQW